MSQIFETLFDVGGTEAVFLLGPDGQILSRTAPAYFADDFLLRLSRRLGTVMDGHESSVTGCQEIFVRFTLKCVYARRHESGFLVVITNAHAVMNQLRVASGIVLRQLAATATPPPAPAPPAVAAPPVIPSAPSARAVAPNSLSQPAKPTTPPPTKTKRGIWD